jgi:hypothetical protein
MEYVIKLTIPLVHVLSRIDQFFKMLKRTPRVWGFFGNAIKLRKQVNLEISWTDFLPCARFQLNI